MIPLPDRLTPHEGALEIANIEAEIARRTLLGFTQYTKKDYEGAWFHKIVSDALDRVLAGTCRRLMVFQPPQTGKALSVDTPIPTPDGWRCIGDLKIDDLVFNEQGHPTPIIAVSPVWKNRPSCSITLDTNEIVVADHAHEWIASINRDGRRYDSVLGRRVKGPRRFERCETNSLAKWRTSKDGERAPLVKHHTGLVLPYLPLPIDPYVLGQWLGNGSSHYAAIHTGGPIGNPTDDYEWVRAKVSDRYPTSTYSDPNVFGIPGLQETLNGLGLMRNKHIPPVYLRSSQEQRLALLQGLIDSDGYVNPEGDIEFCSVKKELAEQTRELVISLGIKARWCEGRATLNGVDHGPKYRVNFFMEGAASLPRKAANCRNQERPDHYITVEQTNETDTVCIEIAAPSHLFLVGRGMIPTCNSELVSRRFPAYVFGKKPDTRIIACSYNAQLAQSMSMDVQKIMATKEYRIVFPETHLAEVRFEKDPVTGRRTHQEKRTQSQFDIVGRKGKYLAAGVDGAITGVSADLGILDDAIKNRSEAESDTYRERVWEFYKTAFSTRQFGNTGAIVIAMTRWHTDDICGRLLDLASNNPDADQWEVINLPAIKE